MLSSKITTPNKAGTLKGVSPISSNGNVMVKVKDTASFIEAARAVHGDKYDYSSTVWTKANDPISFKCNCCGKTINLYTARKHIQEKQTGCGKCHRKPTASKQELEQLRNRQCKICGNKINSINRHKVTCSAECGRKSGMVDRAEVKCCSCGKAFEKRVTQVLENNCCSSICQIEWALKTNQGGPKADWLNRSKKAKLKWRNRRSKDRIKSSEYGLWLRKASEQRSIFSIKEGSPWKRRCASARAMLAERLEPAVKKEKTILITDWIKACDRSHRRFIEKVKRSNASPWMKKITTVESSMRKRRQLRNAKQST